MLPRDGVPIIGVLCDSHVNGSYSGLEEEGEDHDLGPMMCFARAHLQFFFCTLLMQACCTECFKLGIGTALSEM